MKSFLTTIRKLYLSLFFGWGLVLGAYFGVRFNYFTDGVYLWVIILLSLRYKYLARFNWGGLAIAIVAGFSLGLFFGYEDFDIGGNVLVSLVLILFFVVFIGAFVSAYNLLKETLLLAWHYIRLGIQKRKQALSS